MAAKISPSLMCIDFENISDTLKAFEKCGIEYLHVDIMDGAFVPNITLGTDFCKKLREMTSIPLDIHMMVYSPENKLNWFDIKEGEYVSVHYESTPHIHRALSLIKEKGAKAMVALNPATPVSVLDYIYDIIDGVLIMTVNPGFAGQKLIPSTLQKITDARKRLEELGRTDVEIEVDGNVSFENAIKMKKQGADIFVGGSSSIFSSKDSIENNILKMREHIKEC